MQYLSINQTIEKIEQYLKSNAKMPIIVDVQNYIDLEQLVCHFKCDENNEFIKSSIYCKNDNLPRFDNMFFDVKNKENNVFITELTTYLKFLGEEETNDKLNTILHMNIKNSVVIISFQCAELIKINDPRIYKNIYIINNNKTKIPILKFIQTKEIFVDTELLIEGIDKVAEPIETGKYSQICIATKKKKETYEKTKYEILDFGNSYSILVNKDSLLQKLNEKIGTEKQWEYLLKLIKEYGSFINLINEYFIDYQLLEAMISNYDVYNDDKKWLYFIALKVYGAKSNVCLNHAINKSNTYTELIKMMFNSILEINYTSEEFKNYYLDRKNILSTLKNTVVETGDYCKLVKCKQEYILYYLTDNTREEKELIFYSLYTYYEKYKYEKLKEILGIVYPDLAIYIEPYHFVNKTLYNYFKLYNYSKITNHISDEFKDLMITQSKLREFNSMLMPRQTELAKIDKSNASVYFLDALGVEFLSYILNVCKEYKLIANISLSRCNLPSITTLNKEFMNEFENGVIKDIKDLDDLKHEKTKNVDYGKTNLPIHLIDELNVIKSLIERIYTELNNDVYNKVIIISDHGASRLAVIQENPKMWKAELNGEHSGRCCKKSESDIKSEYAIEENGYLVLANYDRFEGSRKANVEVHGGATLEEVVVPIIEITKLEKNIEVIIENNEIIVSHRKKAELKLFITMPSEKIYIKIDEKIYYAESIDENNYLIKLHDIKKAGVYRFDIFVYDNLIQKDLTFTIKKESFQEKELL